MRIGIQPDRSTRNESYSEKWAAYYKAHGIEVKWLDLLGADALDQVRDCDGVMWRWVHNPNLKQSAKWILFVIENYLRTPVFPSVRTSWHYDEKSSQYYLLRALGVPVPQTWLFWREADALEWAKTAPYPVVFKLSAGAAAQNVVKVTGEAQAARLIRQAFRRGIFSKTLHREPGIRGLARYAKGIGKRGGDAARYLATGNYPPLHPRWWKPEFGYAYFQEFLAGNDYDTRVAVIGDRAFAVRRMNRPNDFRASGSGNFRTDPSLIDPRCLRIAFEASRKGGFQSMSYDFMFRNDEPLVGEVSYTCPDYMVHDCPGHWNSQLEWIDGPLWPGEAQAEDFVRLIQERKQAEEDGAEEWQAAGKLVMGW